MAGTRYVTPQTLELCTAAWLAATRPLSRGRALPELSRAALLVLDLQRYFAEPSSHAHLPALEAVLPRVLTLIRAFRQAGRPVVYTRHGSDEAAPHPLMRSWWRDELRQGEPRAALVDALEPLAPDLLLPKARYSAFAGTELEGWLRGRGCEAVVICGVMTHLCCESTAREAFVRDLAPVLVADGCASLDEELHRGALRAAAHGFAVVASSRQVAAALGDAARSEGRDASEPAGAGEPDPLPARADLVVVGAGPAGLAAAIQARRNDLDLLLLDPGRAGGQAWAAERIENYPGFPGGIAGARLMERFVAQAAQLALRPAPRRVAAITAEPGGAGDALALELEPAPQGQVAGGAAPERIGARAVIVATGSAPRGLDLALPTLDPPLQVVPTADRLERARGARILVIGGGEAALDQALLARRRGAAAVTVAVRGAAPRALELLVRRARAAQIELRCETTLAGLDAAAATGAVAELDRRGERTRLPVDAIVVCIGKSPRLPALPAQARGADGRPDVDALGRTPVPGLYLAGDARRGPYRQVAIAVGDGVAAAMNVVRFLNGGAWRS